MFVHKNVIRTILAAVVSMVTFLGVALTALPAYAADGVISLSGSASSAGARTAHTVRIPATAQAGDALLLFLTTNSDAAIPDPAGWTLLQTRDGSGVGATVWSRAATAAIINTNVTVTTTTSVKSVMSIAAYHSSIGTPTISASAVGGSDTSTSSHVAPSVAVAGANSWLVSYFSEKSSTTATWTAPSGVTSRQTPAATGSGRVSALLGDSAAAVATGTAAARTATTSVAVNRSATFSVVVRPGSDTGNQAPTARFTSSCSGLTCSFDASTSTDPENQTLTYSWNFGDGSAAATGVTASRTYASAGTRTVTLTVSDGTLTGTSSASVTTTSSPGNQPVPGHTAIVPDGVRLDTVQIPTYKADGTTLNGEVSDIEVIGNKAYVAGSFTRLRNSNGTFIDNQPYLYAFNMDTGAWDSTFRPNVSGSVDAVEASLDGTSLYITGTFTTVNGVAKRKLAKINPTTGATDSAFTADLSANGTALAVTNNWVYVGGFFTTVNNTSRSLLAAVNPATGAVDTGFNIPITSGIGSGGTLKVMQLQLTSNSDTLVVCHTGRYVGGQQRVAVAQIDTATKTLKDWNTNLYADYLPVTGGVTRVTNVDISPDNSYMVLVSGGGGDRPPVSDTAVALPMAGGNDVQELWVSRLFDSNYGVAITEKAVYIAGHFRYMEAPTATQPWPGSDTQNYGWGESLGAGVLGPNEVVRRDMLGALDPATGTALGWNPTAEAALGHSHLEAVPRGLLVGMDSSVMGGQAIGRFGFYDFQNVPAPSAAETYIDYPYDGALGSSGAFTIEGRSEASSGVGSVQLEIRRAGSNGQYLQDDLTTWGAYNTVTPTQGSPGQAESSWTFTVPAMPAGDFVIRARTLASNGTRDSSWAQKRVTLSSTDNPAPKTTVTYPAFSLATGITVVPTSTFTVKGSADDDSGIVGVSLEVVDRNTNLYLQNDGTLAGQSNRIPAGLFSPGAASTQWEQEFTLPDGSYKVTALSTDDEGQVEHAGLGVPFTVASTASAPAVTLDSLTTGTTVAPGTRVQLAGTATDSDGTVVSVEVSVRNNQTGEGVQIDGSWGPVPAYYKVTPANTDAASVPYDYITPALTAGSYTIRVRATDNQNNRTPTTATPPSTVAQPNVSLVVGTAGDALPNTTLDFASSRQDWDQLSLPVTGTATDDHGVKNVQVRVYNSTTREYLTNTSGATSFTNTLVTIPVASPGAVSTTFSATFTLPDAGNYQVTAIAVDSVDQLDGSSIGATSTWLIFPGDADPTLNLSLQTPTNGGTYTNTLPIGGRAEDDHGISQVRYTVQNTGTGLYLQVDGTMKATSQVCAAAGGFGGPTCLTAYLTNPGGAGSNFASTTPTLAAGTYALTVTPVDNNGQTGTPYTATVTVTAG